MRIKISVLCPEDLLGTKVSGIGTWIRGFIKYAPSEFQVEFIGITSDRFNRPVQKWQQLNLGKRQFDCFPLLFERDENVRKVIPLSLRFTAALKFSRQDFSNRILHFHRIEPAILFRSSKLPKLAFVHNDIPATLDRNNSELTWRYFPGLYKWLEASVIESVDYLFTVNRNTLRWYECQYPRLIKKCSFLPTFTDTEMFSPTDIPKETIRRRLFKQDHLLSPKGTWILYVGRLQKQKNPLLMIDAFAEYHRRNRDSILLMIGAGNLKSSIENRVKEKGLFQSVQLLGVKSQETIVEYYRAADVLLLTSNYEGMPISILEALACGLPVVACDAGEIRQVVKDGFSGEIVKKASPDSIANALNCVLHHLQRYRMENCVKSISEYTPEKILGPIYDLSERLNRRLKSGN
jgi:glycosyltransferase involved in cell wall biosynthesis